MASYSRKSGARPTRVILKPAPAPVKIDVAEPAPVEFAPEPFNPELHVATSAIMTIEAEPAAVEAALLDAEWAAPTSEAAPLAVEPAVMTMPEAPTANVSPLPSPAVEGAGETMRGAFESGLIETRANMAKAKVAADAASSAFEASYASTKSGVAELNAQALEAIKAGAHAHFDFLKSMLGAKSFADVVTLQTEFLRKQVEMMAGQSKEFSQLAKKVASESVEPIKAQVAKTLKIAV